MMLCLFSVTCNGVRWIGGTQALHLHSMMRLTGETHAEGDFSSGVSALMCHPFLEFIPRCNLAGAHLLKSTFYDPYAVCLSVVLMK